MKAEINYRKINTTFSNDVGKTYDGHLTIHFRWGEFYPNGRNPLAHKEIGEMVKQIKPELIRRGIGSSVVNCNFGEWEDVTFQYVKKENIEEIFNLTCKLFKKSLVV